MGGNGTIADSGRRRRLWRLAVVAVFCGVLTNVAVAWVLSQRSFGASGRYPIHPQSGKLVQGAHAWVFVTFEMPGRTYSWATSTDLEKLEAEWRGTMMMSGPKREHWVQLNETVRLRKWSIIAGRDAGAEVVRCGGVGAVWREMAAGWPMLAMAASLDPAVPEQTRTAREYYERGIPTPIRYIADRSSHAYLPLRPLWPGFLVNTVAFAVAWVGILTMVGWVRRRLRVKPGQCVKCRYELAGVTGGVCPECGEKIK